MLDYIKSAYRSTKEFFAPEDEEQFKRSVRRWTAHGTFLLSALGGAGAGIALRDALESEGSENLVVGQLDSATTALGMSDGAIEGACIGAGVGGGVGLGKGLHSLIHPEERVEIDLPYVQDEVDSEEAQRLLRREQRKTRLAMIDIAETVGVEDVSDLANGYAPIQSLTNAIMEELEDVENHPGLLDIRTRHLDEAVARVIVTTLQGVENAHPSVVRTITENESRDDVIEAAEKTISVLESSEEEDEGAADESESEQSSAASNGEADEPAEAAA